MEPWPETRLSLRYLAGCRSVTSGRESEREEKMAAEHEAVTDLNSPSKDEVYCSGPVRVIQCQ